ncbi:hypothetical protein [Bradyrhizobium elkanii]|uniref:hypothetical protein n=1 Tax=Bradyrhizobium elkanii TaxID=29448 RepID=UPI00209D11E9|nr:hypothetical protein [Bradyrhizobium elkanii]MCP1969769.1 hypothetical protein [Bradyrhizobium elkanii]MCS4108723.1 hypothetical protein [Bradyrhizobium elkanii]
MSSTTRRCAPQLATTIRRVEPLGHGMVRMYFAVENGAAWEDRAVLEMPCASVAGNFAFAVDAVRAIEQANGEGSQADAVPVAAIPYRGTVN